MFNFGIRAHDLTCRTAPELLDRLTSLNVHQIQLALGKSLPQFFSDTGEPRLPLITNFAANLSQRHISVPILGCYTNIIDNSQQQRLVNLTHFKQQLAFAHLFPGSIVATETGSVSPDGYTTDNFTQSAYQSVVNSVTDLVNAATRLNATVGIEPGINHPLHTNQLTEQLLQTVNNSHLKIIYDPVNLITIENYQQQEALMDDAFARFGPQIAAYHLKDFLIENDQIKVVPAGQGIFNHTYFLNKIKQSQKNNFIFLETAPQAKIPLMLQHFNDYNIL